MKIKKTLVSLAVSMAISATAAYADPYHNDGNKDSKIQHVLLISVDGLHQTDLDWYVKNNSGSTLASLVRNGVEYKNASTPFPSDSFPGMVAQVTGGNPVSTGIYYDDSYSRGVWPNGTTKDTCLNGKAPGGEVFYAEPVEVTNGDGNFLLDAGQGIANLYPVPNFAPGDLQHVPTAIFKLASGPDDLRNILIEPTNLPVDPISCDPIYPHEYLQVNTIFEVAHANGLRTAWSDKHPAYEILNGPSGYGIDDLFAPEINSAIDTNLKNNPGGADWTKNNIDTQKYDTFKVLSVVNEINGYDHSGKNQHGTPAIFGMNFQAVSTAQKLNKSPTPQNSASQLGGYNADGTPGSVIVSALNFVDASLKQMQDAINNNSDTQSNTAIIISAKHGQSPVNRSDLTIINDGNMIDALNAAWLAKYPKAPQPLVAHAMDDDGILLWLNDRTKVATDFAGNFLMHYSGSGIGSDASGNKVDNKPFTQAGLQSIYTGAAAGKFIGFVGKAFESDQRVPDVIGVAKIGSVYGGGKLSKIAEHGGNSIHDRHVPIVVSGPGINQGKMVASNVATAQIAPTILSLLGLDPKDLQAVQIEKTKVLPSLN